VEERTLDELWERIEKEDPVLWAQMEKFYGPMSKKILLMEWNRVKHKCKKDWRFEKLIDDWFIQNRLRKHGGKCLHEHKKRSRA